MQQHLNPRVPDCRFTGRLLKRDCLTDWKELIRDSAVRLSMQAGQRLAGGRQNGETGTWRPVLWGKFRCWKTLQRSFTPEFEGSVLVG